MKNELLILERIYLDSMSEGKPVARDEIRKFMKSEDPEILGSLYAKLTKREFTGKINPSLEFSDYKQLFLAFYRTCIINDFIEADNIESFLVPRHIAAIDFGRWFISVYSDKNIPRRDVADIKKWFEDLYLGGDQQVRSSLITGSLEHMIASNSIKKLFSDWKGHPILGPAYREALSGRGMKI